MPEQDPDGRKRNVLHTQPRRKRMSAIVKVEVGQSAPLTSSVKGVAHLVVSMPGLIVKNPGHIVPGS